MTILKLSICYDLFLTQINQNNDNSDNFASELKYCFDSTLLCKYFYPNDNLLPIQKKKWSKIVYLHTEFQWATHINKELFQLLKKHNAPSKHLYNLNFLHLNRENFPNTKDHNFHISDQILHQLRQIIIRNHPLTPAHSATKHFQMQICI